MEQWEYTVFALSWDRKAEEFRVSGELEFSATTMIDALNRIGESGWEIFNLSPFRGVSVLPGEVSFTPAREAWEAVDYRVVCKRRKQ